MLYTFLIHINSTIICRIIQRDSQNYSKNVGSGQIKYCLEYYYNSLARESELADYHV